MIAFGTRIARSTRKIQSEKIEGSVKSKDPSSAEVREENSRLVETAHMLKQPPSFNLNHIVQDVSPLDSPTLLRHNCVGATVLRPTQKLSDNSLASALKRYSGRVAPGVRSTKDPLSWASSPLGRKTFLMRRQSDGSNLPSLSNVAS